MKPTELMKQCGSQNGAWRPESPEHWRWMLANGEGPERALAWIKIHSIGHGSPWCIDDAGRALTIRSLAANLDLALKTAENFCYQLASEGRIRTQKGRIFYRANVPESTPAAASKEESATYDAFAFVQRHLPPYLHDSIRTLPPEQFAKLKSCCEWEDGFFAESVAWSRAIVDRVKDTTLAELGLVKKRMAKDPLPAPRFVNVSPAARPDFVQGELDLGVPLFVQTAPNGLHNAQRGSAQTGSDSVRDRASISESSTTHALSATHANGNRDAFREGDREEEVHASSSLSLEVEIVARRLQLDDDAASKLLLETRKIGGSITARELVHLAQGKLLQMNGSIKNRAGFLLTAIPKIATGTTLTAARAAAVEEFNREHGIAVRDLRRAEEWLGSDPGAELRAVAEQNLAEARATLARLDTECGAKPKTKGQTA